VHFFKIPFLTDDADNIRDPTDYRRHHNWSRSQYEQQEVKGRNK
jgi:hypothetical protein